MQNLQERMDGESAEQQLSHHRQRMAEHRNQGSDETIQHEPSAQRQRISENRKQIEI